MKHFSEFHVGSSVSSVHWPIFVCFEDCSFLGRRHFFLSYNPSYFAVGNLLKYAGFVHQQD